MKLVPLLWSGPVNGRLAQPAVQGCPVPDVLLPLITVATPLVAMK